MKLYTEEQLINTVEAIRDYLKNYPEKFNESMIEKHLKNLTPIELPTDEEIDKDARDLFGKTTKIYISIIQCKAFKQGAEWMRDKIQGGNNEQQ